MNNNNPSVRYMSDVQYMPSVRYMPSVTYMPSVQYMPSLHEGPATRGLSQTPYSAGSKQKDTTTKINSLADILTHVGREKLIEETPWLDWYDESDLVNYFEPLKFITDSVLAPVVIAYNNWIEPVAKTFTEPDYGAMDAGKDILFNTLNELSEDADVLANIVKSQVPSAGGEAGSLTSLLQSVGLNGPRKVYNYNTGNTVADIFLEVISDPVTWATIIFSGPAKAGEKAATTAAEKALVESGLELSDDLIKIAAKEIVQGLAKSKADDRIVESVIKKIFQETADEATKAAVQTAVKEAIKAATVAEGYRMFKAASTLKNIEQGWQTASQWMTPIGPIKLATPGVKSVIKSIYSSLVSKLEDYNLNKQFVSKTGEYKNILESAMTINNATNNTVFENNKDVFFRKLGIDSNVAQGYYLDMLTKRHIPGLDEIDQESLNKMFVDYLSKHNDTFARLINTDFAFKTYIDSKEFKELVEALSAAPIAIHTLELEKMAKYRKDVLETLRDLLKKYRNNSEEIYKYIDDEVLKLGDKHYGLKHIEDFFNDLLLSNTSNKEYFFQLKELLETAGVNFSNAQDLDKVLKSTSKDKSKQLIKIIEKSHNIKIFDNEDQIKTITKLENQINDTNGQVLNKAIKQNLTQDVTKIKNIKEAVTNIQADKDVARSVSYIQQVVRLQELPEYDNIMNNIKTAMSSNPELEKTLTKDVKALKAFYKDTERILTKLDKDTTVAFDIPKWYVNLETTQEHLKEMYVELIKNSNARVVKARTQIAKMLETLEAFRKENFIENLVNYTEDVNNLVIEQLSHVGMFDIIQQHTHLSNNKDIKFILDELANKESIYRTKFVPDVIALYEQADMPAQAETLKKVIAEIDTVSNIIQNVRTRDLNTSFKLSNKTQNTLKNILFDEIDNNKNVLIADILADDKLSKDIQNSIETAEQILPKRFTQFISDNPLTYRETIENSIKRHIEHTPELQEVLKKETVGLNIKDVNKEIEEQLNKMLDDYIKEQSYIGDALGIKNTISLSATYGTETIDNIKLIADIGTKYNIARTGVLDVNTIKEYDLLTQDLLKVTEGMGLGIDEINKINADLAVPIKDTEVLKTVRQIAEQHNLYSYSIESGMFTSKHLINSTNTKGYLFEETYKLNPSNFKGTNAELSMLSNKLMSYNNIMHEAYKYEDDYIKRLKEALIETYSRPNALFRPEDPISYFNNLEPQQLLSWEIVSSSDLSVNNHIAFEQASRKYKQLDKLAKMTTADRIAKLDNIYKDAITVKDDSFALTAQIARDAQARQHANNVINAYLMEPLHSLDDLGRYKEDLITYFEEDVKINKDIYNRITAIENTTQLVNSFEEYGNIEDMRKFANKDYGYEVGLDKPLNRATMERSSALALSINEMNEAQLENYIARNTPGAGEFINESIILVKHADNSVTWEPLSMENLFPNIKLDDNSNLMMKFEEDADGITHVKIRLKRNVDNPIVNFKFNELATGNEEIQQEITNLLDDYRPRLGLYSEDVPSNLLKAETLNEDTFNKWIASDPEFFGDAQEQKLYLKLTPQGHSSFFDKSFERINTTIIGGGNAYNLWNSTYSDTFIPRSLSITQNTLSGLTSMVNRSNKINKYLTLFFNNDWSLSDSPVLQEMFKDASSQRIKDFFETGAYKVAILKKDKDGLPKVYELYVHNRTTLDKAAKAGGILVPRETFSRMRQVVNSRELSNELLDVYRRVVPSTYKSMYLFTAGFPFRNALDSLLYKNINEEGLGVLKYEFEASKALQLHDSIQKEALKLADNKTFNKEQLLEVLSKHTKDEIDTYYLTDLFITSNASGGLSKSLGDFLEKYNKENMDDIRWLWEKVYEDKILFGEQPWNPLYRLRDLNDHIEQTARMGLFLASVDHGIPINNAIKRVIDTHFDYSSQHDLLDICERIFWFSTFPINNFSYYTNGGLERNPMLYHFLLDTQTASWNNGEYTYEELKKTKFLAYHAGVGNLRIGNWIIKTSPSVFDFINLISDPVGNVKDRLNPILAIPMNADNLAEELNPLQTQVRNWKTFWSGRSPIPSILARIDDYDYARYSGRWRNYTQRYSPSYNSYPKIRKAHAYARYVRKYYARKYKTNVRRFTRTSLYHDDPNYYRIYRKGVTYMDL